MFTTDLTTVVSLSTVHAPPAEPSALSRIEVAIPMSLNCPPPVTSTIRVRKPGVGVTGVSFSYPTPVVPRIQNESSNVGCCQVAPRLSSGGTSVRAVARVRMSGVVDWFTDTP